MKLPMLLFMGLFLYSRAVGQESATKEKIQFQAIIQGGMLAGSSGYAGQLQTIQGVRYKTWSAGIGAGIDYYYERSVPLFLQLRKNIFMKPHTPFVYADLGGHSPWLKDGLAKSGWMVQKSKGGLY